MEAPARPPIHPGDLGHLGLGFQGKGQALVGQAGKKAGLLDRTDGQRAAQPEGGDIRADLFIAVVQPAKRLPHGSESNPSGQLLVDGHIGNPDGPPQAHRFEPLPDPRVGCTGVGDPLIHALHRTEGQTDQGVGNFEGGGGREALGGTAGVEAVEHAGALLQQHERARDAGPLKEGRNRRRLFPLRRLDDGGGPGRPSPLHGNHQPHKRGKGPRGQAGDHPHAADRTDNSKVAPPCDSTLVLSHVP